MQIWLQLSLTTLVTAGVSAVTTPGACADLAERYNSSVQPRRWVSYLGVLRPLAVWSTPDPAQRALAHLLARILRHLLGYEDVVIRQLNSTQDALQRLANISHQLTPEEFVVAPGIRVTSSTSDEKMAKQIQEDENAFIRAYSRPRLRLRAELSARAAADARCDISATDWLHFSNFTPGDCDFLMYDEIRNDLSEQWGNTPQWCMKRNVCAAVIVPGGHSARNAFLLQQFVSMQRLKLAPVPPPNNKAHYNNRSLLTFFELESSLPSDSTYMFVHKHLVTYANRIARTVYPIFTLSTFADIGSKFSKANESIHVIEENACQYILQNQKQIDIWLPSENSIIYIQYFLCQDDPYIDRIEIAMDIVQEELQHRVSFTPQLLRTKLICDTDPESTLATNLEEFTRNLSWPYLGAVIAPKANVTTQYLAYSQETLLMLYESQENPSPEFPVFLSTADRDSIIAAAMTWLVSKGYKTVTLKIENRSPEFIENIQKQLRAHDIRWQPYTKITTAEVLILDADPDNVERLACDVAEDSSLTKLLLLREWSSRPLSCLVSNGREKHLLVSMWTVSGSWQDDREDSKLPNDTDFKLRRRLQVALGNNWPPQAAPMADAILTAAHALNVLYHQHPQFIYDLHGQNVTSRLLAEIVRNSKTKGVTQSLRYTKNNSLNEPMVFITHWENGLSARLDAVMRILIPSNKTRILWARENYDDNTSRSPSILLYSMTCMILLGIMIFLCVLGFKYRQATYQKSITHLKWPVPTQLAALEMRRDELELHEKLGEGITGRVFLALWRGTNKIHVAVKTPILGSSGALALLWEARMIAPLRHPNVVRLLGILTNGHPPLIVLEYAIHGDLRRYLAETERAAGGPKGVSPVLLTRLAREAAAALAYLASRNMVHRDVRAANCLIDEHHTLKLADFGLARALPRGATEGVGTSQYLCRRRALFPVSWMAPESLKRGVFSLASDIWSYGVLLIELVTMGARPFGDWTPHVTLYHVVNGGTPPLPPDASLDMRELTQQCWARAANSRVTAAQALAFLQQRRSALTPCAPVASLSPPPIASSLLESSL